jgi:type III secretion protein L
MKAKNIIKSTQLEPAHYSRRNLLKRSILDAQTEADRILSEAQRKAAEIESNALKSAAELLEKSYHEGRERATSEFTQFVIKALDKRDKALQETEKELLRLSVKLAEKIIGHEIKVDRRIKSDIVANALRNARQQERLTVRINPADFNEIQEFQNELNQAGRVNFLDLIPDPRITTGGCVIESDVGTIDARLDTQLRVLERALLGQSSSETT